MNFPHFFKIETPAYLHQLTEMHKPVWGSMNGRQMLEHLRKALVLSTLNVDVEVLAPEEKIPALQAWLKKDKPMMRFAPKPEALEQVPEVGGDLEKLKVELMDSVHKTLQFYHDNPDYTSVHPNFGRLNVELYLHLHRKHFIHHFTQFGLIKEL